jgi:hypothetical protein
MENLNFQPDSTLDADSFEHNFQGNSFYSQNVTGVTWPLPLDHHQQQQQQQATMSQNGSAPSDGEASRQKFENESMPITSSLGIRTSMPAVTTMAPLQTAGFAFSQTMNPSAPMLTADDLQYGLMSGQNAYDANDSFNMNPISFTGYPLPLHASPIEDLLPTSQEPLHNSIESTYLQSFNPMDNSYQFNDFNSLLTSNFNVSTGEYHATSIAPSPQDLSRSLSHGSDASWTFLQHTNNRQSLDGYSDTSNQVVSPQNLHVRTDSSSSQDSDAPPLSAHSYGSFVEIFGNISPEPDCLDGSHQHGLPTSNQHSPIHSHQHSPIQQASMPHIHQQQIIISSPTSVSTSPSSSAAASPKAKRRNSPISPVVGITPKTITKKKAGSSSSAKEKPEKKIGKRKGPLRPEQRQQAHEIRKLRACLRCKFLKKVCNKGDPCNGCQPAHARLWQVPCTRMNISDIGYFYKDWTADYERHVTCGMSITNIKGFSPHSQTLLITHGYEYYMPIPVREVYVVDEKVFEVDWTESIHESPRSFEFMTARLSANIEGISHTVISQYLDLHVDSGFESFVDEYFEGTKYLSELLKTVHRYYLRTKLPIIRKGLKLVVAYALTLHITLVQPFGDEDPNIDGRIDDEGSRYYGKIAAPVMVNFQVKKAMADMWRELMKDVLEELQTLLHSVYNGSKLKNWPTIFMLSSLVLTVWEMMMFDSHYRIPDKSYVSNFCDEMEKTPIGVIVGLFGAISTKVPSFLEWDSRKHSHVLNNDVAACDTMTEVRAHVQKHGMESDQLIRTFLY